MLRGVSLPPGWVWPVFRAGPLPGTLLEFDSTQNKWIFVRSQIWISIPVLPGRSWSLHFIPGAPRIFGFKSIPCFRSRSLPNLFLCMCICRPILVTYEYTPSPPSKSACQSAVEGQLGCGCRLFLSGIFQKHGLLLLLLGVGVACFFRGFRKNIILGWLFLGVGVACFFRGFCKKHVRKKRTEAILMWRPG